MPAEVAGDPLVEVAGLEVRFGKTAALAHVDLAVRAGEIVTLIGPNGAGKTTLVRAILGLVEPSGGAVRRRANLAIGYVPQKISIDPILPLTVRRFLRLARRAPRERLLGVLGEVGAADLLERGIHDLSGGQFRRTLLARALLREPDLLVLDEPVQGIDFPGQVALYDLIGRLRARRGLGVLMVSHDLHIVMAATDRVVCLNSNVCCSGAPEAVSRNPEYIALFGVAAARGVAVYTHEHDHAHDLEGHVVPAPGPTRPQTREPGP